METDDVVLAYRPRSSKLVGGAILPELDAFLHLLIVLHQLDNNNLHRVRARDEGIALWPLLCGTNMVFSDDPLPWGSNVVFFVL